MLATINKTVEYQNSQREPFILSLHAALRRRDALRIVMSVAPLLV
jgi:hypothetical protein